MKYPESVQYTIYHLWVSQSDSGEWLAGITDYAQDLLGDIVFIQPPNPGETLQNGVACGIVESVKTGSDLHAPANGVVTEVNDALLNAPEGINDNPYTAWIFKFKPLDNADMSHLLTAADYTKSLSAG